MPRCSPEARIRPTKTIEEYRESLKHQIASLKERVQLGELTRLREVSRDLSN
jgi:hypothetical protein